MAVVLEAVALRTSGRHRKNGNRALQCLNRRLVVHAEHDGVLWRIQIQADHVRRLLLEVRVVRRHVPLQAMRLETRPLPRQVNYRMAHSQVLPQSSGAPVRRTVRRRLPRNSQDPRPHRRCQNRRRATLRFPRRERRHAAFTEPLVPLVDQRRRAPETLLDGGPGRTRCEEEDNPGAPRVLLPDRSGTSAPLQFAPFGRGQDDAVPLHIPTIQYTHYPYKPSCSTRSSDRPRSAVSASEVDPVSWTGFPLRMTTVRGAGWVQGA